MINKHVLWGVFVVYLGILCGIACAIFLFDRDPVEEKEQPKHEERIDELERKIMCLESKVYELKY